MKNLLLLTAILVLNSCATIINTKKQRVYIYTKEPTKIYVDDVQLESDSLQTRHKLIIKRGKNSKEKIEIDIKSKTDSRRLVLQSSPSPAYYGNFVLLLPPATPIGVGGALSDYLLKNKMYHTQNTIT